MRSGTHLATQVDVVTLSDSHGKGRSKATHPGMYWGWLCLLVYSLYSSGSSST